MTVAKELHQGADGVLFEHPTGMLDMTNEEYHAAPGISKSHLDKIAQGPFVYWREYLDPERPPREETADMMLGTAIHTGVLEPDQWDANYVQSPEFNMRSNAGKSEFANFVAENPGKVILRPDDYAMARRVIDAVLSHPVASELLKDGRAEQSFFAHDPQTGALIKCRTDFMQDGGAMVIDLKSVKEGAVGDAFGKEVANHNYLYQPAWYYRVLRTLYGRTPDKWVFIAAEKARRPQVGIHVVKPEQIELCEPVVQRHFLRILECRTLQSWPDPGCEPRWLEMPGWWKP